ncbi:MAG: hydrogenase maturation protease [Thermoplasmata archaeon]|nr:MAG: hydrogenase maturation protease [Thermoplasmata archaeon]MCD6573472.1 hydrogenase maturation protease [Thermoplasmata archaeon]
MRSIIVGVGNPLLGDDAVGLEVARMLKEKGYDAKEAIAGGIELAEMIAGYDFAIIIDAFHGIGIKEIDIEEYNESVANHDISFPSAYKILARYTKMPEVKIIGIGVKKIEVGEQLSSQVEMAIPAVIEIVEKLMEEKNVA